MSPDAIRIRRSPLKRTGRLRPMSAKRRRQAKAYSLLRAAYLESHPKCELQCGRAAKDIHHTRGRLGGNLLNTDTWMGVCRTCHDWIHQHPKEARSRGLLA